MLKKEKPRRDNFCLSLAEECIGGYGITGFLQLASTCPTLCSEWIEAYPDAGLFWRVGCVKVYALMSGSYPDHTYYLVISYIVYNQ